MEFRKVPGFLVEVSDCGIIRRESDGYVYAVQTCKLGYKRVGLFTVGKKRSNLAVHRAVAMAWIPNPENKSDVNHIDLNKANNHASNLEWATKSENHFHASKAGRKINCGRKKNPERDAEIKRLRKTGATYKFIGETFGISGTIARRICLGHKNMYRKKK